jgi:hypothetical protein
MNPVRLFTLDGAQKQDLAVERWFASHPLDLRSIARKWFQEMRACGPDVLELLHDGHPTACLGNLAWGYVNTFADHVNVGFYFGAVLGDPSGLLEGSGKFMRHVKVRPGTFVRHAELQQLVRDAYADTTARLSSRAACTAEPLEVRPNTSQERTRER